ncbi:hypothetical protein SAMN05421841_0792 [Chryseobacterium wanjuense]|uniref:GLPGLI family protein n=1 Tax=Chryseobacterium wanjuense TaxID=356305 RepID=A0A1I0NT86_9FLAO|nr:hypothetical protein [Chryseobacterium wanjuense]SEW04895.1 hypothetical protein SAMN05421841_0792 [Chryseobacterium wanjuense]
MKKITLLLLILCFNALFSQKEEMFKETYFPVKYVLKSSKDTIKTKILNIGFYSNEEFSPATYIKQMTVLDPSGNKVKVPENNILYLEIVDLKKVKRKFVDAKSIISKDLGLVQIIYSGKKTDWYRKSSYSGSIYTYKTDDVDYLKFHKDKSMMEIHFDIPGAKYQIKEKFYNYPDLALLIDNMVEDTDLLKVLKLYDKK